MISRNRIIFSGFVLEKLQNHDDIADFDCGDPDLNEYFREDSIHYRAELLTQTYCYYREDGGQKKCIALVDFCNDSLARDLISNRDKRMIGNAKRHYRSYPAVKITRLGVSRDLQGKRVGSYLLNTIKRFFVTDNRSGCRFLTVDAYRTASGFYEKTALSRSCCRKKTELRKVEPSRCFTICVGRELTSQPDAI